MTLDDRIRNALQQVCDPCSLAAHAPLSIVDMGLVRGWRVEDGHLTVTMCVTSPSCTMGPNMVQAAEALLGEIEELKSARVEFDASIFWSPEQMTDQGKGLLAARRSESLARAQVKPQQWRHAALTP